MKTMTNDQKNELFASILGPIAEAAKTMRGRVRVSMGDDRLSVDVERAFAVNASMSVRLQSDGYTKDSGKDKFVMTFMPVVDVSWSSTQRSVAAATAAIALYREITELAAEAETLMNEQRWETTI